MVMQSFCLAAYCLEMPLCMAGKKYMVECAAQTILWNMITGFYI